LFRLYSFWEIVLNKNRMIVSGFNKEHYGTWENAGTKGLVTIKASRHGDFLEFNNSGIVFQHTERETGDELIDHTLQDRYEIVTLKSSNAVDANKDFFYTLTLKQFKLEFDLVLKFNVKNLKICKNAETLDADMEPFGDVDASVFDKK
jgi:hypothetical protein